MFNLPNLPSLVFYTFTFLFSITMHEYAHGAAADLMGDPTPRWSGRLTLNPLAHLDLLGTLAFLLSISTGFGFGWAKPVPINPRYFRDAKRGLIVTGLAGPVSNLLLAAICALPLNLLPASSLGLWASFLAINVLVNTSLGMFNLIPLPPLDGSRVLEGLLPDKYAYQLNRIEMYGPFILLLLLMSNVLFIVLNPLISVYLRLLGLNFNW